MQIYLAVTPGDYQEAARYGRTFAHVAYRLGEGSTLLRQNLLLQARGGLLTISDRDAPAVESPETLCAAVLRECGRRGYTGVLLDFEAPPTRDRLALAAQLSQALSGARRTLYVPEPYGAAAPAAVPLICTALSGGSFSQRLREAAERPGGAGRLALDVQRLRMDFSLPSPTGEGEPLTAGALESLMEQQQPTVFFSQDLCARYFTYARDGQTHFVLFDDADTLNRKLLLGQRLGFSAAFLMWPEIRDVAGRLTLR